MLNGLDLFSGIGGLSLAVKPWVRTIAYCEQDRYCQAVLMSRMQSGELDEAPIWDDVRTLRGSEIHEPIDMVFGGFPCQDISVAGAGAGLAGERSGLFFEIVRLVSEVRPSFVFLENVPAIRTRGLREVVGAFTELRYDCRWTTVSAAEVGAPHLRKRWFLLAHASCKRRQQNSRGAHAHESEHAGGSEKEMHEPKRDGEGNRKRILAHANSECSEQRDQISRRSKSGDCAETSEWRGSEYSGGRWETEPDVGRVANGIPSRMDRVRGLGNACVPLQAKVAFERLAGLT